MHDDENRGERLAAFDTSALLRAVEALDAMRGHLDGDGYKPPEMRNDLLRLHQLAMRVVNEGSTDPTTNEEMFALAADLEYRIDDVAEALDRMQETISALTALAPDDELHAD
ncbi:MAG: transposase [Pseudomonadales bacterium]|nr:transposase [Pseudomonadales bacterium]|tara:strand:- start:286 stop:621 length:336 start_codon:yes stop_codon:yes gene_type:complete